MTDRVDLRESGAPGYARNPQFDRLMQGAVYALVLAMPFSILYPLSEPLRPDAVALYFTAGLELADIPASILLVLAVLERWLTWRSGASSQYQTSMFARIVLFIGVLGLVSIVVAEVPRLAAFTAMRWLLAAGVLCAMIQTKVLPQRLAYVLGVGLCVHTVLALLQVWYAGPIGLPGELTLYPGQGSAAVVHVGERLWLRGYGMTFHPNVLGGYLAVALILLLPLSSSRLARLMSYLLVAGLAATLSRSAGLGLLLVVPPFVWWLWRADPAARPGLRRAATAFGCVALVSLAVFWKPISVRLNPLLVELGVARGDPVAREQDALLGRQKMNAIAVDIMRRHPLLGIGAGNFPIAMEATDKSLVPQYVHNVPLLLGAEVGVGGLLAWLAMAAWAGYVLARGALNAWTVAGAGALSVLVIVSFFDCYPWSLNAGRLLTVTVLALLESSASAAVISRPQIGTRI